MHQPQEARDHHYRDRHCGWATGSVNSEPPGLSVDGAGRASKAFAEPVKLTATPKKFARAVFSGGGCDIVGDYGQTKSCHVPLAPDPQVGHVPVQTG